MTKEMPSVSAKKQVKHPSESKQLLELMIRNPGSVLLRHKNDKYGFCWRLRDTINNAPLLTVSDTIVDKLLKSKLIVPTLYEGKAAYELAEGVQIEVITGGKKKKFDVEAVIEEIEKEKVSGVIDSSHPFSIRNRAIEKCLEIIRKHQKGL